MTLMGMFDTADGNQLFSEVGAAVGVSPDLARQALDAMCPIIATALQRKLQDDPELIDELTELLADNREPGVAGEDAMVDGKAMLAAIYGTQKAAAAALKDSADGIPQKAVPKLAAVAAVTVVAAVAERTGAMPLAGVNTAMGNNGVLGTLLSALIAGAIQGVVRQLTAKRRTTTSRTRSRTSRRTTRKKSTSRSRKSTATRSRNTNAISIEDILGSIFGNNTSKE